MMRFIY